MASEDKPKIMLWDVELWQDGDPTTFPLLKVEKIPAETRFAVIGEVGSFPYIHIAEDDETRLVTVLAVVDVKEAELPGDAATRFPQAGMWLSMAQAGAPRVLGASRVLTRAEVAEALGGHSPPPSPTTIKTS